MPFFHYLELRNSHYRVAVTFGIIEPTIDTPMKSKRLFAHLAYLLLAFLPMLIGCQPETKQAEAVKKRPNIIFIMSDDHAYQAISAYGGALAELAPTPNIDRIARQGMLFNNCLVTNSICGPSRATILTGKYSHLNGFIDNTIGSKFDFSQESFAKVLQQAGYKTATIGKLHLGGVPTGFDYYDILPDQGRYYNPQFINKDGQYEVEGYATDIITDKTLQWLDSAREEEDPFMVMMWHKAPHRNWEPGPNELGMYEDVTFPEPESLFDDYSGDREAASLNNMTIAKTMKMETDLKMMENAPAAMTEAQKEKWNAVYGPIYEDFKQKNPTGDDLVRFKYQRYMRDYLACVSAVDKSVGRLLDYLKTNGLEENTIVIYTSDQGFYLGEHGWFDKRWMYRESLRTPLLISWPDVVKAGSVSNQLVSNLDFGETLIDIAEAQIPADMQGASLLPILKGETPSDWRQAHYYHYYEHPSEHNVMRHYGITTSKYKLIHYYYDIDKWELFDLEKDPQEMQNVYNDPAYAEVKTELHQQLDQLRSQYQDSDSLNQMFIEEYHEKVKENPVIEYWKYSREEIGKMLQEMRAKEAESK
ncbi:MULTISPECIES: sulfatase [unclassified Imperialibacter]|nr:MULTISPECIES: sulfatase [unclassified Imperialibacter]CAD5251132.1 N-acetylglucosamine-6-O-sulfatase [Imperialibacter sp. 89]CAD5284058.1 N-acetylglucosamine-6-O-sulfatase [Imperialibacter sp. 75]VVT10865.1 Arylsulfatase A [Imperialibacter sp. EC-SDR9]